MKDTEVRRTWLTTDAADLRTMNRAGGTLPDIALIPTPSIPTSVTPALADTVTRCAHHGTEVYITGRSDDVLQVLEQPWSKIITGVVVAGMAAGSASEDLIARIGALETVHGPRRHEMEVVPVVDCAHSLWHIGQIVSSSPRIHDVWLDEDQLGASLGVSPLNGCDPLAYARGRFVCEVIAQGARPVGLGPQLAQSPLDAAAHQVRAGATMAHDLGFTGIICRSPAWISPVREALTPSAAALERARRVRHAFADGVKRGTAAVALDGQMVDLPVDARAAALLDWGAACEAHDTRLTR